MHDSATAIVISRIFRSSPTITSNGRPSTLNTGITQHRLQFTDRAVESDFPFRPAGRTSRQMEFDLASTARMVVLIGTACDSHPW